MDSVRAKALIRASCELLDRIEIETHADIFEAKELRELSHKYKCRAWQFLRDNGVKEMSE